MPGPRVWAFLLRLPLSWRGVGALIVGILLARWTWVFIEPHTLSVFPAKSESAGSSVTLFGVATPTDRVDSIETGNLTAPQLVGVFSGKHGFAIFRLDEKRQVGVGLGEEVYKGTKLVEVAADYVLIERNEVRQRINLEGKSAVNTENIVQAHPSPSALLAPAIDGSAANPEKMASELQKMIAIAKAKAKENQ